MWDLLWIAVLLLVGYAVGSILEQRHYASIRAREADLRARVFTYTENQLPAEMQAGAELRLLSGGVVVSVDAFKRMAAKLHSFFGGRVTAYESLLDRARREAILRLRERADSLGATMVFGLRLETSAINDGDPRLTTGIELLAYGTAVIPHRTAA